MPALHGVSAKKRVFRFLDHMSAKESHEHGIEPAQERIYVCWGCSTEKVGLPKPFGA